MLICPHCKEDLIRINTAFVCKNGHSFDIASQGYCNLLVSGKDGKFIGDNNDMVIARRNFLDAGYYEPLKDELIRTVTSLSPRKIVDCGCGEGYYTSGIASALLNAEVVGIDISKAACKYASKRDKHTQYITASSYHTPVKEGTADVVLSIFAPTPAEEFLRILNTDGKAILVVPGDRHLFELKQVIYDEPYLNREEKHVLDGFKLTNSKRVEYMSEIKTHEHISALFSMTPYAHRTPKDGIERLNALDSIKTTLSFLILTFAKK